MLRGKQKNRASGKTSGRNSGKRNLLGVERNSRESNSKDVLTASFNIDGNARMSQNNNNVNDFNTPARKNKATLVDGGGNALAGEVRQLNTDDSIKFKDVESKDE